VSRHVAYTVMAPIRAGLRDEVARAIEAMGPSDGSPLTAIPGLHRGRVTLVERLEDPRGATAPVLGPYLDAVVDADPPEAGVVEGLARACAPLFARCEGCPDTDDRRALADWLSGHRIKDSWTIMPYAEHSLPEIERALALRERFGRFAAAEALNPGAAGLRDRFLAEFGAG
jgi:hypothetical protein